MGRAPGYVTGLYHLFNCFHVMALAYDSILDVDLWDATQLAPFDQSQVNYVTRGLPR